MSAEPLLEQGPVDPVLLEELPGLRVLSCAAPAPRRRATDAGTLERLALLAERMRGARAVELRREPVPAAYRVFYRHVGIDPDSTRTPIEEAALGRLLAGGHRSGGPLADALALALLDTGVLVNAFDAAAVASPPGLRPAAAGERLAGGTVLGRGRLVLADDRGALAALFGPIAPAAVPDARSEWLTLVAVQIPGVPAIHVEEALWTCSAALEAAGAG